MMAGRLPRRPPTEYPDADHRVVTMYGYDRKGKEFRLARVVYTRRR